MKKLNSLLEQFLKRYELSLFSIGLFRITLSVGLIISLLVFKIPGRALFFYHDALFDVGLNKAVFGPLSYSLLDLFKSHILIDIYFILCLFVFALLALGYRTRILSILSLLLYWQLNQRGFLVASAADLYASCMLIIAVFLPLDSTFVFRRFKRNNTLSTSNFHLACFFAFIQIGLIYFGSGMMKADIGWIEGTAVRNALNDNLMSREIWRKMDFSGLSKFSLVFLIIEALIGILILLNPFRTQNSRWVLVVGILLLHIAFIVFLDLWQFMLFGLPAALLIAPISLSESHQKLNGNRSDKRSRFMKFSLVICILLVALINVKDIVNYGHFSNIYKKVKIKRVVNIVKIPKLDYTSFLSQRWMIYSFLPDGFGCFSVEGRLPNDQIINLWTNELDDGCVCQYTNYVQKNFLGLTRLMVLLQRANPLFFSHWTQESLHRWNEEHPNQRISESHLYYNYLDENKEVRKKIRMVHYFAETDSISIDLEAPLPIMLDRNRSD